MPTGAPSIDFEPRPEAAPMARAFLRHSLRPSDGADALVAAANELVTNAIIHARSTFTVTVTVVDPDVGDGVVRVSVTDANPRLPQPGYVPPEATSGRGLAMIDSLGLRWGVERTADGKVVWVEGIC